MSSPVQSRRRFLSTVTSAFGAAAFAAPSRRSAPQNEIKTALNGPVGLQLWSLRGDLPKDLRGVLGKVRAMGFREVEGAGLWGHTAADLRAALDSAGLRCQSAHMGYERLRDDSAGAFAEAKALGAAWVVCPWIPHEKGFTRDNALRAAELFNTVSAAAEKSGLRFAYHCHGYEFAPSPEGTLWEVFAGATDPARVNFQVDVFHAYHGGTDPARLIARYKGRVPSLHLKDLKKGLAVTPGTATGRPEEDVPVGTGQIDMPAVLRAAASAGTTLYYIEDESADPWRNIPRSIVYLEGFKTAPAI